MGYDVVHVDELEPAGPGGAVRFVRREFGVAAFGINWYELPPGGVGREHDEADSGQEEVNVVVQGAGVWRVGDTDVPVRVGTPEGMTFVAVGARRGSYEPRGPF
jgi:uncharacterized cupin superfamily protein